MFERSGAETEQDYESTDVILGEDAQLWAHGPMFSIRCDAQPQLQWSFGVGLVSTQTPTHPCLRVLYQ